MNVMALAFHIVGSMGLTFGIFAVLLFCGWQMLHTLKQGTNYVRRLHQIPCSHCAYFSGDYRLKCTVNPMAALTEEAIDCVDYVSGCPSSGERCVPTASSYQRVRALVKQ